MVTPKPVMRPAELSPEAEQRLLRAAFALGVVTVVYNVLEGLVSAWFGWQDETLALFGFGLDSFVEVISGLGVMHMLIRMKRGSVSRHDRFERQALKVTGFSFYLLCAGLLAGALANILGGHAPLTTVSGMIVSTISILTMWALMTAKQRVGERLGSAPIIADARCTRTCFYLSFILLASSLLYALFRVPYVDAAGSVGIAWFAFREGREAFEKAKSGNLSCDDCC
jgi:divalent metal cation (Fe/Co/Zn/Cd) transporter